MRSLAVAIGCTVVLTQLAWAEDAPAPGAGSGSATEEKVDASADALRLQPQAPPVRGGTLGLPSVLDTSNFQAIVSGTPATTGPSTPELPSKIGFDVFARLGGLQPFTWLTIDVLAESYKQSLPHVDLHERPVLPRMALTEMRDVGFRVRLARNRETRVSVLKARAARTSEQTGAPASAVVDQFVRRHRWAMTVGARFLQRASPTTEALEFHGAAAELIGQYTYNHDAGDADCKKAHIEAAKQNLTEASTALTPQLTGSDSAVKQTATAVQPRITEVQTTLAGTLDEDDEDDALRKLEHAEQALTDGPKAPPVASETDPAARPSPSASASVRDAVDNVLQATSGCKKTSYGSTFFAGFGTTLLHTQKHVDDTENVEDPLFKEARFTAGWDLRTSLAGEGTTLLPRFGAYASLSRGWWHDRFALSGGKDIDAYQFEGAIYASGHFGGGLDAVVSFVALKPYGRDSFDFLINVAPAIGATLKGK